MYEWDSARQDAGHDPIDYERGVFGGFPASSLLRMRHVQEIKRKSAGKLWVIESVGGRPFSIGLLEPEREEIAGDDECNDWNCGYYYSGGNRYYSAFGRDVAFLGSGADPSWILDEAMAAHLQKVMKKILMVTGPRVRVRG
jgi:hypothetical protein